MRWISKDPPLWIWPDDDWEDEKGHRAIVDVVNLSWKKKNNQRIAMPDETTIKLADGWYNVGKGFFKREVQKSGE